ncbi:hypothetical protein ACWF94_25530 [Streptomyces sp. NPDC055078]
MGTTVEYPLLSDGERKFVDKVADYYAANDGMEHARGQVIGWLMICDPAGQTARQLSGTLGVPRETVDRIVQQITPLNDDKSVFAREGELTDTDYTVWMRENRWAPKIEKIFADLPALRRIIQSGLDEIGDAPAGRRRRLANMERFLGYMSTEIPGVLARAAAKPAPN